MSESNDKDKHSNIDAQNKSEEDNLAHLESTLSPEQLELIQKRIADRFYEQEDVLKEIVDRILKSKKFNQLLQTIKRDKKL